MYRDPALSVVYILLQPICTKNIVHRQRRLKAVGNETKKKISLTVWLGRSSGVNFWQPLVQRSQ